MTDPVFLPELAAFNWAQRDAYIAFDSDISEKPRVAAAETRLADELRSRGATIFRARLPDGPGGEKAGLDDYLVAHSTDDLVSLLEATPPDRSTYDPPVSLGELMTTDYPPIQWVWDGLVLQGEVNLLYGDGGVGKSLLALYVACAAAGGAALFDRPTRRMPTLVLFAEDGEAEVQRRSRVVMHELGIEAADIPVRFWCQPREDTLLALIDDSGVIREQARLQALRSELARLGEPALIVLDGFADLFALNESLRLPVNAALKRVLGGLCRDYGATVLVLAHPSKASMADGTNYSGSTAFNNAVRQRLNLKLAKSDGEAGLADTPPRCLQVAKSNYGPLAETTLWFHGYVIKGKPAGPAMSPEEQRAAVLETMLHLIDKGIRVINRNGNVGDARTLKDFAKSVKDRHSLNLSWQSVKDYLRVLTDEGHLSYQASDSSRRPHVKAAFLRGPKCEN